MADAQTLEGTSWHLARGVEIPDGVTITARFAGGTLSGQSGVNRYRADYELDGDRLRLGPAASTMMAGPEPAMAAEQGFLTLLGAVAGWQLADDGGLTLTDADGAAVLWFAAAPTVAETLTGRWEVRSVHRRDALASPTIGSEPYLEFGSDGSVSGSAGINRLHGKARLDGDRLHLGPLQTTRMAGSPELMDEEHEFLAALERVAIARIEGDRLELTDADGQVEVSLARAGA
ncbi:MAG TPA: META domain-containing protein, partial [Candidatus Limnocylindrales bacterium]